MTWNTQRLPKGKPGSPERRTYERARYAILRKRARARKYGLPKGDPRTPERRAYDRARHNPEALKTKYAARREHFVAKSRADRARDPEKHRNALRRRRGLPEPTRPQPALCECCGGGPVCQGLFGPTLAVDHCHASGVFRGWLCHKCNSGIGLLGDDLQGLRRALAYLERAYAD